MTALDTRQLQYERMSRVAESLGMALDMQAEVMRDAVRATVAKGPKAGMDIIVEHVRSIPELAEGLELPADTAGEAQ